MSEKSALYRVQFISNGEQYDLYVREIVQGHMFGFIEIADFVWNTHTTVLVDPSHEKLKSEFEQVTRTYIPMHNVLRIDQVKKQGLSKITELDTKVTQFPSPIYTPKKDS